MSHIIQPGYCTRCEEHQKVGRKKVNHRIHLIMTLFTIGIWSAVWAFFAILGPRIWQCEKCGSFEVLRKEKEPSKVETLEVQEAA